jgi:hypothetical protein
MNVFIFREKLEMQQLSTDGSKFDTLQRSEVEKLTAVEIETIRRHEIKKSPRTETDPLTRAEIETNPRTREANNLRMQELYTNLDFESTHYENI